VPAARAAGLLLGMAADAVFGDPRRGHPVAGFGRFAAACERRYYRDSRARGVAYALVCTGAAVGAGRLLQRGVRGNDALAAATTALATWATLGGTSLRRVSTALGRELAAGDLEAARTLLPRLCGRDPGRLGAAGVARACVESVAENTSDAVVAPLCWGALAGVPGLLGYRAVNTLDAMVGHVSPRYRRFGWAAARLDDVANYVPARLAAGLTVLSAPQVGGSAREAWRAWCRDSAAHPSPNAGQVEAAFAGALGIRLGGWTPYRHGIEQRPALGTGREPAAGDVDRAAKLSRLVSVSSALTAAAWASARGLRRHGLPSPGTSDEAHVSHHARTSRQ
jgi:adenosylcobinamide-phosphate synthase